MPRECAFCPNIAKKSGEHIWSDWMDKHFPFKKIFKQTRPASSVYRSPHLDSTAKVVCENCNNTWMSKIENEYAQPVMTPLILGQTGITITQSMADAIARFAFKTAVILDHLARNRQAFFPRSIRHGFRQSHAIPTSVRMWLAGFKSFESGIIRTIYHEANLSRGYRVELYVCTYSVGHLAFQVASLKNQIDPWLPIKPADTRFEFLAIPFWPWISSDVVWPPSHSLETVTDFDAFAFRWHHVLSKPPR